MQETTFYEHFININLTISWIYEFYKQLKNWVL